MPFDEGYIEWVLESTASVGNISLDTWWGYPEETHLMSDEEWKQFKEEHLYEDFNKEWEQIRP